MIYPYVLSFVVPKKESSYNQTRLINLEVIANVPIYQTPKS